MTELLKVYQNNNRYNRKWFVIVAEVLRYDQALYFISLTLLKLNDFQLGLRNPYKLSATPTNWQICRAHDLKTIHCSSMGTDMQFPATGLLYNIAGKVAMHS